MKFSKTLQHLVDIDRVFGLQYIQYKALKKFLKQNASQPDKHIPFMRMVENEHQRVSRIIECKLSDLQLTCTSLITNVRVLEAANKKGQEKKDILMKLQLSVDELSEQLASLDRFVYYNMEGFRKILKKHDKTTALPLSWLEVQRMRTSFVNSSSDLERLLVELSDLYKYFGETLSGEDEGEHTVSDATFERKSYKYWVATEDVFRLKTRIIKHLPLHIFDRKVNSKWTDVKGYENALLRVSYGEKGSDVNYQKMGWISSVYLDNDNLDSYRARVNMKEGATLYRFRWYGNPEEMCRRGSITLPQDPAKGLYFERKTHHESWVVANSLKERFPISGMNVTSYIKGEMQGEEVTKGEESIKLAVTMQKELTKQRLHPLIRTVYKRAAFQKETTNDVRITLDTQLKFVNEKWETLHESRWKRDEEEIESKGDWEEFSFAVLEVKLKVPEPQWLTEIFQAPYIRQVHKFSKYQQACATFFPDRVHLFPYWFTDEDIEAAKARQLKEDDNNSDISSSTPEPGSAQAYDNPAFLYYDLALASDQKKVFKDYATINMPSKQNGTKLTYNVNAPDGDIRKKNSASVVFRGNVSKKEKGDPKLATKRLKIEPKTYFANERTMLQWIRMAIALFTLGGILWNFALDESTQISGLVFMCAASIVILYGVTVYYCRMRMIRNKRGRYDDWVGPGLLTLILLAALATTVYMHFRYQNVARKAANPFQSREYNVNDIGNTIPPYTYQDRVDRDNNIPRHIITTEKIRDIRGLLPFYMPVSLTLFRQDQNDKGGHYTCSGNVITRLGGSGHVISNVRLQGLGTSSCIGLASLTGNPGIIAILTEQHMRSTSTSVNRLVVYDTNQKTIIHQIALDTLIGYPAYDLTVLNNATVFDQAESHAVYNETFIVLHKGGLTGLVLIKNNDSDSSPQVAFRMRLTEPEIKLISVVGKSLLMYDSRDRIRYYDIEDHSFTKQWITPDKAVSGMAAKMGDDGKYIKLLCVTSEPPQLIYHSLKL